MSSAKFKTPADRKLARRLSLFLSFSLFVLISLYIFVFAPLYIYFVNDVLYMGTVLPEVFSLLSSLADIFIFGIFYGVILYVIHRFSLKASVHLLLIYGGGILYKNVGNLLMTYITDGLPTDVLPDLLNTVLYLGLELLQTAGVVTIAALLVMGAKKREAIRKEAAVKTHKVYTPSSEYLPFSKILNFKNPLQKAAFWMAAVPMLVKVVSRLIYDVWFTMMYGFYEGWIDILWMVLYYSLDIVGYGVAVYFIMIFVMTHFHTPKGRRKDKTAESAPESLLDKI